MVSLVVFTKYSTMAGKFSPPKELNFTKLGPCYCSPCYIQRSISHTSRHKPTLNHFYLSCVDRHVTPAFYYFVLYPLIIYDSGKLQELDDTLAI